MNGSEFVGGLAILAVSGWLTALVIASLLRGGWEGAITAADLAGSIALGGGGLLLFFLLGAWMVIDAF